MRKITKMPGSHPENRPWVLEKVKQIKPITIADIGAGAGTYSYLIKPELDVHMTAVEIFKDNITTFNLHNLYEDVLHQDVRSIDNLKYDLVIFGDVLEHMTKEEALAVWNMARRDAKYAIINIPIIHYEQGALDGNHHEIHVVDDWNHEKVLEAFEDIVEFNVGEVTGAYLASFKIN